MSLIVQSDPSLVRDEFSKAIINTDQTGYQNYLAMKEKRDAQERMILEHEKKLQMIQQDVSDIKGLLMQINSHITKDRE